MHLRLVRRNPADVTSVTEFNTLAPVGSLLLGVATGTYYAREGGVLRPLNAAGQLKPGTTLGMAITKEGKLRVLVLGNGKPSSPTKVNLAAMFAEAMHADSAAAPPVSAPVAASVKAAATMAMPTPSAPVAAPVAVSAPGDAPPTAPKVLTNANVSIAPDPLWKNGVTVVAQRLVYDAPKPSGAQEGAIYRDPVTKRRVYVKHPSNSATIGTEVLAAQLARVLGVTAPDVRAGMFNGKPTIFSPWLDGFAPLGANELQVKQALQQNPALAQVLARTFPFDIWVANYDVVGPHFDNILVNMAANPPLAARIDFGGALEWTGFGQKKSGESAFTSDAGKQVQSMLLAPISARVKLVFGSALAQPQLMQPMVNRIDKLTKVYLTKLASWAFPVWLPGSGNEEKLASTLVARGKTLAEALGALKPKTTKKSAVATLLAPSTAPAPSAGPAVSFAQLEMLKGQPFMGDSPVFANPGTYLLVFDAATNKALVGGNSPGSYTNWQIVLPNMLEEAGPTLVSAHTYYIVAHDVGMFPAPALLSLVQQAMANGMIPASPPASEASAPPKPLPTADEIALLVAKAKPQPIGLGQLTSLPSHTMVLVRRLAGSETLDFFFYRKAVPETATNRPLFEGVSKKTGTLTSSYTLSSLKEDILDDPSSEIYALGVYPQVKAMAPGLRMFLLQQLLAKVNAMPSSTPPMLAATPMSFAEPVLKPVTQPKTMPYGVIVPPGTAWSNLDSGEVVVLFDKDGTKAHWFHFLYGDWSEMNASGMFLPGHTLGETQFAEGANDAAAAVVLPGVYDWDERTVTLPPAFAKVPSLQQVLADAAAKPAPAKPDATGALANVALFPNDWVNNVGAILLITPPGAAPQAWFHVEANLWRRVLPDGTLISSSDDAAMQASVDAALKMGGTVMHLGNHAGNTYSLHNAMLAAGLAAPKTPPAAASTVPVGAEAAPTLISVDAVKALPVGSVILYATENVEGTYLPGMLLEKAPSGDWVVLAPSGTQVNAVQLALSSILSGGKTWAALVLRFGPFADNLFSLLPGVLKFDENYDLPIPANGTPEQSLQQWFVTSGLPGSAGTPKPAAAAPAAPGALPNPTLVARDALGALPKYTLVLCRLPGKKATDYVERVVYRTVFPAGGSADEFHNISMATGTPLTTLSLDELIGAGGLFANAKAKFYEFGVYPQIGSLSNAKRLALIKQMKAKVDALPAPAAAPNAGDIVNDVSALDLLPSGSWVLVGNAAQGPGFAVPVTLLRRAPSGGWVKMKPDGAAIMLIDHLEPGQPGTWAALVLSKGAPPDPKLVKVISTYLSADMSGMMYVSNKGTIAGSLAAWGQLQQEKAAAAAPAPKAAPAAKPPSMLGAVLIDPSEVDALPPESVVLRKSAMANKLTFSVWEKTDNGNLFDLFDFTGQFAGTSMELSASENIPLIVVRVGPSTPANLWEVLSTLFSISPSSPLNVNIPVAGSAIVTMAGWAQTKFLPAVQAKGIFPGAASAAPGAKVDISVAALPHSNSAGTKGTLLILTPKSGPKSFFFHYTDNDWTSVGVTGGMTGDDRTEFSMQAAVDSVLGEGGSVQIVGPMMWGQLTIESAIADAPKPPPPGLSLVGEVTSGVPAGLAAAPATTLDVASLPSGTTAGTLLLLTSKLGKKFPIFHYKSGEWSKVDPDTGIYEDGDYTEASAQNLVDVILQGGGSVQILGQTSFLASSLIPLIQSAPPPTPGVTNVAAIKAAGAAAAAGALQTGLVGAALYPGAPALSLPKTAYATLPGKPPAMTAKMRKDLAAAGVGPSLGVGDPRIDGLFTPAVAKILQQLIGDSYTKGIAYQGKKTGGPLHANPRGAGVKSRALAALGLPISEVNGPRRRRNPEVVWRTVDEIVVPPGARMLIVSESGLPYMKGTTGSMWWRAIDPDGATAGKFIALPVEERYAIVQAHVSDAEKDYASLYKQARALWAIAVPPVAAGAGATSTMDKEVYEALPKKKREVVDLLYATLVQLFTGSPTSATKLSGLMASRINALLSPIWGGDVATRPEDAKFVTGGQSPIAQYLRVLVIARALGMWRHVLDPGNRVVYRGGKSARVFIGSPDGSFRLGALGANQVLAMNEAMNVDFTDNASGVKKAILTWLKAQSNPDGSRFVRKGIGGTWGRLKNIAPTTPSGLLAPTRFAKQNAVYSELSREWTTMDGNTGAIYPRTIPANATDYAANIEGFYVDFYPQSFKTFATVEFSTHPYSFSDSQSVFMFRARTSDPRFIFQPAGTLNGKWTNGYQSERAVLFVAIDDTPLAVDVITYSVGGDGTSGALKDGKGRWYGPDNCTNEDAQCLTAEDLKAYHEARPSYPTGDIPEGPAKPLYEILRNPRTSRATGAHARLGAALQDFVLRRNPRNEHAAQIRSCLAEMGEQRKTPRKGQPVVTFMMGQAGSGKSTWAQDAYREADAQLVDSDLLKRSHPAYLPGSVATPALHQWSVELADRWFDAAIVEPKKGGHIIFDGTGAWAPAMREKIERARANGWFVEMTVVLVPLEVSFERVEARRLAGGHDVPHDVIERQAQQIAETFCLLGPEVDRIRVADNSDRRKPRAGGRLIQRARLLARKIVMADVGDAKLAE